MSFEIIHSENEKEDFTIFGRMANPELKVWRPSKPFVVAVFWKGAMRPDAVENAWKQTGLELVSAICGLWMDGVQVPDALTNVIDAIQSYVADFSKGELSNLSVQMRVRPESGTTARSASLYVWGANGDPSVPTPEGELTREVGVRVSRKNWECPGVQKFIMNLFRESSASGEIAQDNLDDLTSKITEIVRPARARNAAGTAHRPAV